MNYNRKLIAEPDFYLYLDLLRKLRRKLDHRRWFIRNKSSPILYLTSLKMVDERRRPILDYRRWLIAELEFCLYLSSSLKKVRKEQNLTEPNPFLKKEDLNLFKES